MKIYKPIPKLDACYLAGLFDGEGCVQILKQHRKNNRRTRHFYLRIHIYNTHLRTMKWLTKTLGGVIFLDSHSGSCWSWSACSVNAAHVLSAMFPFLKIKKREAKIALIFQKNIEKHKIDRYQPKKRKRGWQPVPLSVWEYRERLRLKLIDIRKKDKR